MPAVAVKPAELGCRIPLNQAPGCLPKTTDLKSDTGWVKKSVFVLSVYTDGQVAGGNCFTAVIADQGDFFFFFFPAVRLRLQATVIVLYQLNPVCLQGEVIFLRSCTAGPIQISPYLSEFSLLITTKNTKSSKKRCSKLFVRIAKGLLLRALRGLQLFSRYVDVPLSGNSQQ